MNPGRLKGSRFSKSGGHLTEPGGFFGCFLFFTFSFIIHQSAERYGKNKKTNKKTLVFIRGNRTKQKDGI